VSSWQCWEKSMVNRKFKFILLLRLYVIVYKLKLINFNFLHNIHTNIHYEFVNLCFTAIKRRITIPFYTKFNKV